MDGKRPRRMGGSAAATRMISHYLKSNNKSAQGPKPKEDLRNRLSKGRVQQRAEAEGKKETQAKDES